MSEEKNQRTDDQILTEEPIRLQLGGNTYDLRVLPIGKAIEWRKKLITATDEIATPLLRPLHISWWERVVGFVCFWRPRNSSKQYIISGLGTAFVAFPEKVLALIFAYAPELPQKEIIAHATEEEVFTAFSQIMAVANPLKRQGKMMKEMGLPNLSPPANSSSSSSPSTVSRRVM